jgi:hypothetical protein
MSEEERKMMDRREYEIADHQSVMWGAEMRGEARGRKEKAMDIVRNALRMNMPTEDISILTGMSIDAIEQLRMGG